VALNVAVSLAVITALFAAIFRFVPDAHIQWSDVWPGALVTAVFFTLGKSLFGMYLAYSNPTSAFGAAGSLALVLLWIYYSAIMVLLGAEFTQVWARGQGHDPAPEPGAIRMKRLEQPG
jgi:membrane protein